ncbi:hypothetical protein G5B37_03815 [Rasiella rasia]|uniref:Uncharacterized protein n=1 Tax=Rasiella rasia TaxID=2744027 RepID=A0A6G6GJK1_9FLAO|nr:hypothetical protein [Rasiella rasia]QIE58718.1 hypothetical protein G5B37_03815 [Rasiella rasia]
MRRAFIGLSSPLGYSYANDYESRFGRPNPVLDSPLGIFLFYDEIWFASRNTCPINCENLHYVRFFDEAYDMSKMDLEQFHWKNEEIQKVLNSQGYIPFDNWNEAIELNLGDKKRFVDNHSRGYPFGKINPAPNPTPLNLMIDDHIAGKFGFELITNSVTNQYVLNTRKASKDSDLLNLTQSVLCENIPSFQLEDGPYHELIEDLRSDEYLKRFRRELDLSLLTQENKSIQEIKTELEAKMSKYLNELILRELDEANIQNGIFNATVGQIPVLSNVYSGLDGGAQVLSTIQKRKEVGWMGFVAKVKNRLS